MPNDDILNVEDNDFSFLDEEVKTVKQNTDLNSKSNVSQVSTISTGSKSENLGGAGENGNPKLMGDAFPTDYIEVVERVITQYKKLPDFNYENTYKELSELTIRSSPTPTLQIINQELQRVQAAKERLSEIMTNVLQSYTLKKRAVDILRDSWGYFSTEKSADKRKGDAIYRLSDFDIDFAKTEALLKALAHVSKNLDGLQDNLSRRITIFQLQLKLHDIGRGALPEFELKDDIDAEFGLGNKNSSDGLEAQPYRF